LKLELIDLEELFDPSRVITNPEGINKNQQMNPDGIFSEAIFGKLEQENSSYQCNCGGTVGKFNINQTCAECKTQVRLSEPLVKRIAWIDIGDYSVLNPNIYRILDRIMPKKALSVILSYEVKLTKEGIPAEQESTLTPFDNIGIIEFQERFDEILAWAADNSKASPKVIEECVEFIVNNRDKAFISKVPVYSSVLRPARMMGKSFVFDEVNNQYNALLRSSNQIKEAASEELTYDFALPLLCNMQQIANDIFEKTVEKLRDKAGFIRSSVLGRRINFSARCVITPLPGDRPVDSTELPYLAFLELYRFQLINLICQVKRVNSKAALRIWSRALTKFDAEIYELMMLLIDRTEGGIQLLLNRNPTINFGSIVKLQVTHVKRDIGDYTASIHNLVLPLLGADYDGDTLNFIPLLDQALCRAFAVFSPRRMLVDRNDGSFNKQLGLDKDMILGIHSFCAE
jgi:DNA-directed RNA polymerase beta' subunit